LILCRGDGHGSARAAGQICFAAGHIGGRRLLCPRALAGRYWKCGSDSTRGPRGPVKSSAHSPADRGSSAPMYSANHLRPRDFAECEINMTMGLSKPAGDGESPPPVLDAKFAAPPDNFLTRLETAVGNGFEEILNTAIKILGRLHTAVKSGGATWILIGVYALQAWQCATAATGKAVTVDLRKRQVHQRSPRWGWLLTAFSGCDGYAVTYFAGRWYRHDGRKWRRRPMWPGRSRWADGRCLIGRCGHYEYDIFFEAVYGRGQKGCGLS